MPDEGAVSKKTKGRADFGRPAESFVDRIESSRRSARPSGATSRTSTPKRKASARRQDHAQVVSLRQMDAADRARAGALLDVYRHALGMV